MEASEPARPGLRGLDLKPGYDSSERVLETFYVPALSRATRYARSVGYFRSSALSVAARGLSRFINSGGTVRLLCGAEVSTEDRDALLGQTTLDGVFAQRLAQRLVTDDEVARKRLEVLAWLAREGRLQVRIVIAVDGAGNPVVGGQHDPYFHEKIGALRDVHGDGVAFQGSVNESATAWTRNFESFSVYCSWDATATHFSFWANKFEEHWAGHLTGFKVYELPEAARNELISLASDVAPNLRDPEEPLPLGDDAAIARYLMAAPRLVGAEALPEATTGVELFPHQRQVVERLAGQYPRSWLVADEVGLGKTISAGLALRRLSLSGQVKRALILAPANVCRQWQDELFEKFGLWVPRLEGNKIHSAHPDDVRTLASGTNPYAEHETLIVSSHLARRPRHQELLLDAAPYDLVIVDEAHHARRSHVQEDLYRPGRLLELLDRLTSQAAAKAVWLLSATPMQVAPVELRDLLIHTGLHGPLADEEVFLRYFRELAKEDDGAVAWAWLDQTLQETPRLPAGPAEDAVLDRIRDQVGPIQAAWLEKFGTRDEAGEHIVEQLNPSGREGLRTWLRTLSPVGQYVTRHSRETLKQYRAAGLLSENLADRDVEPVVIAFTAEEQTLYDELQDLIARLMEAHGTRRGAGFVLTVYQRRLTSSWAAIRKTLSRRLNREALALDENLLEEAEDAEDEALDTGHGGTVEDAEAVPLTGDEIAEIRSYIARMATVADSKFDRLRRDLDAARGAGHSTIVFTQFTDTLDDLRDRLVGAYRSQLATFTGGGGHVFREDKGWVEISKRDLVSAIRSRRVTVLLATDSASEGLNLQSCSFLISYDMPWNPMRAEQRIGRIDRLGQARDVIHVRSYFVPNTIEESVYRALAGRIDDFRDLLGDLQPILGATERAFQAIFRAPRSERRAAEERIVKNLLEQVDQLEEDGIDFTLEDPMPLPDHSRSPVTLDGLREVLVERFGSVLDDRDRPVTWDPARASRDPDGWAALATYGHPRLIPALVQRAGNHLTDHGALVLAGGDNGPAATVRADRTPPVSVRSLSEVGGLGPSVARGEAETLANRLVVQASTSRREHETRVLRARRRQRQDTLKGGFIALVHEVLAAGCAASRFDGSEGIDPITVWLNFGEDDKSDWAWAEAFRQRLGVPLAQLTPRDLATTLDPIPQEQWTRTKHETAEQLGQLFSEYRLHDAMYR